MVQTRQLGPLFALYQRSVLPYLPGRASLDALTRLDKTIKLWKVFEKSLKVVQENNMSKAQQSSLAPGQPPPASSMLLPSSSLSPASNGFANNVPNFELPRMAHHDTIVAAVPRKVFANAHAYHINSISINSDGETYMSADDLRINLWNLSIHDQSFSGSFEGFSCLSGLDLSIAQTSWISNQSTWRN